MLLHQRQLDTIRTGRQPVVTEVDRWINNVVPYVLDSEFLSKFPRNIPTIALNRTTQILQPTTMGSKFAKL